MRQFLLTVFAATLCIIEPSFAQDEVAFDSSTSGNSSDVIAFVGKKVLVQKDDKFPPKQDPEADNIVIYMDSRYKARYEILKLVSGNYESDFIDFYAYDHYGIPRFSKTEEAVLLFVHDGPENFVHSKYNFYEVRRTTDGDWAACGNAWTQYDSEETNKEPLEEISFLEPVEVNIPSLMQNIEDELEPGEILTDADRAEWQVEIDEENAATNELYQAPIWDRNGNIATCQLGTRVADLYRFQNVTRFLKDKRDDICRERFSEKLDALGKDYKAKRIVLDDCIALLEIQNLP